MMQHRSILHRSFLLAVVCCVVGYLSVPQLIRAQSAAPAQAKILSPQDIGALMPHSVFFRGQTATVQLRNTFGLRLADGKVVLAGLVDTSGYATGLQQKYQGYLLSENALTINGKALPAGAYGFGFVANDTFVVMDLGAHEVLKVTSKTDSAMPRPRPLMIVAGTHPGNYRLYEGRRFVSIRIK
ncbi:MAG TPA: hypothetical protein VMF56_05050 [Acidobacteriaceae bacterium]|nr:hypothetical protein [Acidobacteriaceae bacterium]